MDTNDDLPIRTLQYPSAEALSRKGFASIRGYIASRGRCVPLDDWEEGQKLFVGNCDDSIRRSVFRMCKNAGFHVVLDTAYANLPCDVHFIRGESFNAKPRAKPSNLYHRPWDRLLSVPGLKHMRDRRENPDGVERKVRQVQRGGEWINVYPWDKMQDGDFFVVPLRYGTERDKRTFTSIFRSAACRYDYEIQIIQWTLNIEGEERPGFRVTRIQPGLASLKRRAGEANGKFVQISKGRKGQAKQSRQSTKNKIAIEAMVRAGIDRAFAEDAVYNGVRNVASTPAQSIRQGPARVESVQDLARHGEPIRTLACEEDEEVLPHQFESTQSSLVSGEEVFGSPEIEDKPEAVGEEPAALGRMMKSQIAIFEALNLRLIKMAEYWAVEQELQAAHCYPESIPEIGVIRNYLSTLSEKKTL